MYPNRYINILSNIVSYYEQLYDSLKFKKYDKYFLSLTGDHCFKEISTPFFIFIKLPYLTETTTEYSIFGPFYSLMFRKGFRAYLRFKILNPIVHWRKLITWIWAHDWHSLGETVFEQIENFPKSNRFSCELRKNSNFSTKPLNF